MLEFTQAKIDDSGLYTARAMNVNGSTISTAELLVGNGGFIDQILIFSYVTICVMICLDCTPQK